MDILILQIVTAALVYKLLAPAAEFLGAAIKAGLKKLLRLN